MWESIKKLFGRVEGGSSKESARNRLRLVLVHDRTLMSPGLMDQLKVDLIAVIGKYLEIDDENIKVEFDKSNSSMAIVASIPVKEVRRQAEQTT